MNFQINPIHQPSVLGRFSVVGALYKDGRPYVSVESVGYHGGRPTQTFASLTPDDARRFADVLNAESDKAEVDATEREVTITVKVPATAAEAVRGYVHCFNGEVIS